MGRWVIKLIAPYGKEPPFVIVPKEKARITARITPYGSTSYRVEVQRGRWIEVWEAFSLREKEETIAFQGRVKKGGET